MSPSVVIHAAATGELSGVAGWMSSMIDALGPAGVGVVILLETIFPPIPSEAILPAIERHLGASSSSWAVLRAECADHSSPDRQRGGDDPCVAHGQADTLEQSGRQARGRERQRDY